MKKKLVILAVLAMALTVLFATPAFASQQTWECVMNQGFVVVDAGSIGGDQVSSLDVGADGITVGGGSYALENWEGIHINIEGLRALAPDPSTAVIVIAVENYNGSQPIRLGGFGPAGTIVAEGGYITIAASYTAADADFMGGGSAGNNRIVLQAASGNTNAVGHGIRITGITVSSADIRTTLHASQLAFEEYVAWLAASGGAADGAEAIAYWEAQAAFDAYTAWLAASGGAANGAEAIAYWEAQAAFDAYTAWRGSRTPEEALAYWTAWFDYVAYRSYIGDPVS